MAEDDHDLPGRMALGWRVTLFMAGIGAIEVLLSLVAIMALAVYYLAVVPGGDLGSLTAQLETPDAMLFLVMAMALPSLASGLGWVFICRRFLDRRPFLSLGFGRPAWGWARTVGLGALGGAAPVLACALTLWGLDGLRPTGVSTSAITWLLIPTFFVMALFEEVLFRGYLLRNFLDAARPRIGLVVSSILFAAMHSFNPGVWSSPWGPVNLIGAGIVLGLAYLVTEELWFATVLHCIWNLTQGVLIELPVSGLPSDGVLDVELTGNLPSWLTGGGFGLEGSVLMTLAEVCLAWVLWKTWRKRAESSP